MEMNAEEYRSAVMARMLRRALYRNAQRFSNVNGGNVGAVVIVHWPDRKRGPGAWQNDHPCGNPSPSGSKQ